MIENEIKIELEERPPCRLAGRRVRTNLAAAGADCPRLWETFTPRMAEMASWPGESYGVSVMVDENEFDYWAALPLRPGDSLPPGLEVLDLPGGLFARRRLSDLGELPRAYEDFYGRPLPGCEPRCDAASFELYPADHAQSGLFSLHVPVRLKD